jgi:hypothetical protein
VAPAGRIQEKRKNQMDKATLECHLKDVAEAKKYFSLSVQATRDELIQSYRSFFAVG